jgi:hypothetical protein
MVHERMTQEDVLGGFRTYLIYLYTDLDPDPSRTRSIMRVYFYREHYIMQGSIVQHQEYE